MLTKSNEKKGEFTLLLIAIDDACKNMEYASILGEGNGAFCRLMKSKGSTVTAPRRATMKVEGGKKKGALAFVNGLLWGYMVCSGKRFSRSWACAKNGTSYGPHVTKKVILESECILAKGIRKGGYLHSLAFVCWISWIA